LSQQPLQQALVLLSIDQTVIIFFTYILTMEDAPQRNPKYIMNSSDDDSMCSDRPEEAPNKEEDQPVIAKDETRAVYWGKLIVFLVLLVSTIAVAAAVYLYISRAQTAEFEDQFKEDAKKVFESIGTTLDLTLGAADSFVVGLVSFALYSNSTWPFVTMPDFAVKAAKLRTLSKSTVLGFYPKVATEQRSEWEQYAKGHNHWVDTGLATQKEDVNFKGVQATNWSGVDVIHGPAGPLERPGPYYPTWMSSPVVPVYSPYNFDLFEYFSHEINEVVSSQKVVIGKTSNLPDPGETPDVQYWIKDFVAPEEDSSAPLTVFYYPVIDKAADHVSLELEHERQVVGVIAITMFWRELIDDILQDGSNGLVIVIGNGCNQTFTYQIMGPESRFLGKGDRHDKAYDYLEKSFTFFDLEELDVHSREYTGLPLSLDFCPYWVKAYPSDLMKDDYTTKDAILFTFIAVIIFAFTSFVFLVYDYLNEKRQQKIMSAAQQSNAIVSSLFPSVVRDRLFPQETTSKPTKMIETPKLRLQSFLRDGVVKDDSVEIIGKEKVSLAPIAELFPDTTVCKLYPAVSVAIAFHVKRFFVPHPVPSSTPTQCLRTLLVLPLGVRCENRPKCSPSSRPSTVPLIKLLENVACSKSRPLATRTLQWWVYPNPMPNMPWSWHDLHAIVVTR